MLKAGIMGGTFNPVHNAHLVLAKEAYKQLKLDKVIFMPSKNPPHKEKKDIVSDEHRLKMLELAIEGYPYFEVSDMELRREGITYTVDTVTELSASNPETEFYFIIGGDSLMKFLKWRMPEEIVKHCRIVAAGRHGYTKAEIDNQCQQVESKLGAEVLFIDMPDMPVSSNNIRSIGAEGNSFRDYLPDNVYEYIMTHQLYK